MHSECTSIPIDDFSQQAGTRVSGAGVGVGGGGGREEGKGDVGSPPSDGCERTKEGSSPGDVT